MPGSRKPTTANTEPARIYRIRNRVSRASLNNRRGGYSISLLKNSPDLSGALLDAGRSAALVTTDRVVHKARQRIELSLRRSELLAIIDELLAEMTVVVIPHIVVRTWGRFCESAIAPDGEVLFYQLLAQGDSKRRAIPARMRGENFLVHLLP